MEVCFLTSGETLTVLEDELQGQTAKVVKKALTAKIGTSRFKQRLFVEDGLREMQDDEFLVEVGAAKDQAANDGATPLLVAARRGHLDIVQFLVEVGAARDQAANDGATPLLVAAENGHLDIVALTNGEPRIKWKT
eukprot:s3856_g3.t1